MRGLPRDYVIPRKKRPPSFGDMARVVVGGGNSQRSHSASITASLEQLGLQKAKIKIVNPLQAKT